MTHPPVINLDRARVSQTSGGRVQIDDPGSPWRIEVRIHLDAGRAQLSAITVELRDDAALPITAARLRRLPLAQILHVAAAQLHPNEVYYRMLATPRRPGQRSWGDDHWQRVLEVARWAQDTRRPGGGGQAVADMWGTGLRTAYRWLTEARLRDQPTAVS